MHHWIFQQREEFVEKMRQSLVALVFIFGVWSNARATVITQASFNNPTVINFDNFATFTTLGPTTSQPFANLGVRFTGSITQSSVNAPFTAPSHLTSGFASGLNFVVRADFTSPVNRVGADFVGSISAPSFFVRIFDVQLNLIEEFRGLVTTRQFSGSNPAFVGLESSQNIARIEFVGDPASGLTTFPRIDNFRFEASQNVTVPEPNSLLIFGSILANAVGTSLMRKKRMKQQSQDNTSSEES